MRTAGIYLTTFMLAVVMDQGHSSCLLNLPEFKSQAAGGTGEAPTVLSSTAVEAVIPAYRFNCSGNVTEWGVYVHPGVTSLGLPHHYYIEFQVWRPSLSTDVCYSWVGKNTLPDAVATADGLVTVTVEEGEQIAVLPGDIVGLYAESLDGQGNVQLNTADVSVTVWYKDGEIVVTDPGMCTLSIGEGMVLELSLDAAPVLTAVVSSSTSVSVSTADEGHQATITPTQKLLSNSHYTLTSPMMTEFSFSPSFPPMSTPPSPPNPTQAHPSHTTSLAYHIPDEGSAPPSTFTYGIALAVVGAILAVLLVLILVIGICIYHSKRKRRRTGQANITEKPHHPGTLQDKYTFTASTSSAVDSKDHSAGDHVPTTFLITTSSSCTYDTPRPGLTSAVGGDSIGVCSYDRPVPQHAQTKTEPELQAREGYSILSPDYDTPHSYSGGVTTFGVEGKVPYDIPLTQGGRGTTGKYEVPVRDRVLPATPLAYSDVAMTSTELRNRQYEDPDSLMQDGDYECVFLDSL